MKLTLFFYLRLSGFCSEPVRLVGGASRCAGTLEVKQTEWRPVVDFDWTLKEAAAACRELDCGSAVSTGSRKESSRRPAWWINTDCVQSGSALRTDCAASPVRPSSSIVELTCSGKSISDIIYDSNMFFLCLSDSRGFIGLNCKLIQDDIILKGREVSLFLEAHCFKLRQSAPLINLLWFTHTPAVLLSSSVTSTLQATATVLINIVAAAASTNKQLFANKFNIST